MPAACFGAGPRAIHGVSKIDVHRRKLVKKNIVGPRPQTNWDSRWHIILHVLTEKIENVQQSGVPTWTTSCLQQHWHFHGAL